MLLLQNVKVNISKSDIANLVNNKDFNNKFKNVKSNKNELNELSKKVKAISTKDLINKFGIINGVLLMCY